MTAKTTAKTSSKKGGNTVRKASINEVTLSGVVYGLKVHSDKVMSFSLGVTHLTPSNKNYMTFIPCKAFMNNDEVGLEDKDNIRVEGYIDTTSYTSNAGIDKSFNYLNVTGIDAYED